MPMGADNRDNGYLSAKDLLSGSSKAVETSVGKVLIRRVGLSDIMQAFGSAPDLAKLADIGDGKNLAASPQGRIIARGVKAVLLAGLHEPKLFEDANDGPTPSDFPWPDQLMLVNAIVEHSGFNKEAAKEIGPL